MKNFTYQLPTRFVFGRGAENKAGRGGARAVRREARADPLRRRFGRAARPDRPGEGGSLDAAQHRR